MPDDTSCREHLQEENSEGVSVFTPCQNPFSAQQIARAAALLQIREEIFGIITHKRQAELTLQSRNVALHLGLVSWLEKVSKHPTSSQRIQGGTSYTHCPTFTLSSTSTLPTLPPQLCPLFHLNSAHSSTSALPTLPPQLYPLFHLSSTLSSISALPSLPPQLYPLFHLNSALSSTSTLPTFPPQLCPSFHLNSTLSSTSTLPTLSST